MKNKQQRKIINKNNVIVVAKLSTFKERYLVLISVHIFVHDFR